MDDPRKAIVTPFTKSQTALGGRCGRVNAPEFMAAFPELVILRVDIALDCGAQVYRDRIRSQLEGAVIMGVSLATLGEVTFKKGRVEQDTFHTYRVTRPFRGLGNSYPASLHTMASTARYNTEGASKHPTPV